jgi:hypothetical protein
VYREADQLGTSPASTHRLVVVSPARRPDPWRRLAADILLGHDLRAAFPGGDTLAQSPVSGAGIGLLHAHADTSARYTKLRRTVELGYGAQTQLSSLPALLSEALRLVDALTPPAPGLSWRGRDPVPAAHLCRAGLRLCRRITYRERPRRTARGDQGQCHRPR